MPKISSYPQIASIDNTDLFVVSDDSNNDATKSMTVEQITTFIRQGRNVLTNNTDPASASNVGSLRYREVGNNSYIDLAMRTGASTYVWINIVENNW
jgi:hypothetical protein